MIGNSEEATRAANLELRSALAGFITQPGRLKNINFFINVYNLLEGILFLQSERT